jgi:hypothetical protein
MVYVNHFILRITLILLKSFQPVDFLYSLLLPFGTYKQHIDVDVNVSSSIVCGVGDLL